MTAHPEPAPAPTQVSIVLADDHPVVREGLAGMLGAEPGLEVVGAAADGREAVRLAAELRPDLVLTDLRMPELDGVGAIEEIARVAPGTHVLVLTTYDTDRDLLRAVEAGAAGYLLKDTPRAQLVDAVRAAARGETVLAPAAAARLVRQLRVDHEALTARELDVLTEVARGTSNAAVAASLSIGEATVKSHLAHVYAKLGVEGRTAAVTRAMELGILPPPGP